VIEALSATPLIDPTGSAARASASTGDVLAGLVDAALASPDDVLAATLEDRVAAAVFQQGWLADQWVAARPDALTADRLAFQLRPVV